MSSEKAGVKVFLSSVEGSKITYKVNSGEWIECEGNYCEITCDEGGNYTIYSKVIIDGMESIDINPIIPSTSITSAKVKAKTFFILFFFIYKNP